MTETLDLKAAIAKTIESGLKIGGYTVRMTCEDTRFRNPSHILHDQCCDLFEKVFDDSQFEVIEVEGKGTFAVFDGYQLCESEELEENMLAFDSDLNEVLDQYPIEDPDDATNSRPQVGLNIGFLADATDIEELQNANISEDKPACPCGTGCECQV